MRGRENKCMFIFLGCIISCSYLNQSSVNQSSRPHTESEELRARFVSHDKPAVRLEDIFQHLHAEAYDQSVPQGVSLRECPSGSVPRGVSLSLKECPWTSVPQSEGILRVFELKAWAREPPAPHVPGPPVTGQSRAGGDILNGDVSHLLK